MNQDSSHTNSSTGTSPPKVSLVFRIGIVGHRPNRWKHADQNVLTARLNELIFAIQQDVVEYDAAQRTRYADIAPVIRALSPLAEGVDRIFAEQAIKTGCELGVIIPFPQAEFEQDFQPSDALEPNSIDRFCSLLRQARTVYELDGSREDASVASLTKSHSLINLKKQVRKLIELPEVANRNESSGHQTTAVVRSTRTTKVSQTTPCCGTSSNGRAKCIGVVDRITFPLGSIASLHDPEGTNHEQHQPSLRVADWCDGASEFAEPGGRRARRGGSAGASAGRF